MSDDKLSIEDVHESFEKMRETDKLLSITAIFPDGQSAIISGCVYLGADGSCKPMGTPCDYPKCGDAYTPVHETAQEEGVE